ncbi:MAG: hypothetical protein AAGM16_08750 [Pseudomonadota bacterium]
MTAATMADGRPLPAWLKRFGAIGFWFFFIKGLLWMAAPVVFYHLL